MRAEAVNVGASSGEMERKRLIWKAVIECVAEDGIAGATMRKVAERAGVSTGMLTYYYRSKKELISDTIAAATSHFYETVNNAAGQDFGPQRLAAVFGIGLGGEGRDPWLLPHSFWLEYWAEAARDTALRAIYLEQTRRAREYFARSVEAGIASGEFRADIDPLLVADLLSALIQGLRGKIELSPELVAPGRAVEICNLALELLAKAPATKQPGRPGDG